MPTVPAGGGVTEMLVGGPLSGRCSERRAEDSEGTESHGLPVPAGLPPMTVRGRSISARQVPKAVGLAWLLGLFLAVMSVLQPGLARAQSPRAWAGSEATAGSEAAAGGREAVRVAAAPAAGEERESASGPVAGETLIPTGNLLATIRDGGILMVPLLGCSFALAVFGIERLVNLRTGRVVPRLFANRLIEQLQSRQLTRGEALDVDVFLILGLFLRNESRTIGLGKFLDLVEVDRVDRRIGSHDGDLCRRQRQRAIRVEARPAHGLILK